MAAAEEISVHAAVAAVLSGQGGIFTVKEGNKNGAAGFSQWKTLFFSSQ